MACKARGGVTLAYRGGPDGTARPDSGPESLGIGDLEGYYVADLS